MKLGIFGGTFDPIHIAHLVLAEEARRGLDLERVIFVPARDPWRKGDHVIAPAEHRLEMVRRAIADNPAFEVSSLELERSGPSYIADTLEELQAQLGPEAELYFLMGGDALIDLPNWNDPQRIMAAARLAVTPRALWEDANVEELEKAIPGIIARVVPFQMPRLDISGTDLRRRAAAGHSLRYLVPPPVEQYIREHRLYEAIH